MPPLLADLIHARGCKLKCEKFLTLPEISAGAEEQGAILIGISDTKKKRQTDWSKCQSVCRFFIKIRVLGVNQFIQNNLICPIPNAVHPGYPFHLILRFQLFRNALLLCQLRNK